MLSELFSLLTKGHIPPDATINEYKDQPIESAFRAAYYLISQGAEFPLGYDEIQTIAATRYGGTQETEHFIETAFHLAVSEVTLASVQASMILRQVARITAEQLGTGEYNFEEIRRLLETPASQENRVSLIETPDPEEIKQSWAIVPEWPARMMNKIGGFNAELIYVAARPKHGKSTFFANLIHATPQYRTLYVTIADYSKKDFERILYQMDPTITARENLWIGDYNATAAGLRDIEGAIESCTPELVIVDRSEKLTRTGKKAPPGGYDPGLTDIADGLRRMAKKFNVPVLTDSQLNDVELQQSGTYLTKEDHRITFGRMAADRTGRAAVLDMFFGLHRADGGVYISIEGRRQGMALPAIEFVKTDTLGVYQWNEKEPERKKLTEW